MFDSVAALMGSADPDGEVSLSGLVERLAAAPPGPTVIGMLAGLPVEALDYRDRALVLRAWERQAAWLAAAQQQALLEVAEEHPSDDDDFTEIEIGAALRMSPTTAGKRVRIARDLATRLPATAAALERGEVSYLQAMAIAEETTDRFGGPGEGLNAEQLGAVEATVLRRAERLSVAETRRAVRRAVLAARPRAADEAHAKAAAGRTVERYPEPDGMAALRAFGPAPDVQLIWNALDARAARLGPDDDRPVDARRFDALVDLARASLADPDAPRAQGRPYDVGVVVDMPTLVGLAENPAELQGYGAISPALARALAADGRWRRWVTEPGTRALLDLGAERYEPSQALRDLLLARSAVCDGPFCTVPSRRCDLDHAVEFPEGKTVPSNLGPACRCHHNGKTHGGCRLHRHEDGSRTWTTPAGISYHLPPHEILPPLEPPPDPPPEGDARAAGPEPPLDEEFP